LGIEAALNEITTHRGTSFDTDVVDKCLRIFHDKVTKLKIELKDRSGATSSKMSVPASILYRPQLLISPNGKDRHLIGTVATAPRPTLPAAVLNGLTDASA
jgi:hypothetical protein